MNLRAETSGSPGAPYGAFQETPDAAQTACLTLLGWADIFLAPSSARVISSCPELSRGQVTASSLREAELGPEEAAGVRVDPCGPRPGGSLHAGILPVGAVWPFPGCQGPSPSRQSGRGLQPLPPQCPVPSPGHVLRTHRSKNLVFGERELVTIVPPTPPLIRSLPGAGARASSQMGLGSRLLHGLALRLSVQFSGEGPSWLRLGAGGPGVGPPGPRPPPPRP